jgi:hypothetical protein
MMPTTALDKEPGCVSHKVSSVFRSKGLLKCLLRVMTVREVGEIVDIGAKVEGRRFSFQ